MTEERKSSFAIWLERLPESVRSRYAGRAEAGASDFDMCLTELSPQAQQALAELHRPPAEPTEAEPPVEAGWRYGVTVVESGEFPLVKLFKTAEGLAKYLGELEGEDVCAVCFYGKFLPITVGYPRVLLLGDSGMQIPCQGAPKPVLVEVDYAEVETQDDGFLGPPELAHSDGPPRQPDPPKAKVKKKPKDKDKDKDKDE